MLAVLGVLVMFGFVILPVFMQGMGFQTYKNPPVVTTKQYGDLKQSSLISLRQQRQIVIQFFQRLGAAVVQAGGDSYPIEAMQRAVMRGDLAYATSDEALVETWLLAQHATELGLVIDDQGINALLSELMQDRVSPETISEILGQMRLGVNQLFAALEQELLAIRLRELFSVSLGGATPAQRWDYFQRLRREVSIESFPVRVADFVDKIPDPDESTIRGFFAQHKLEFYDPWSPEPGFREPKKAAFEYLKADYATFVDRVTVTDEEIEQEYEKNKDRLYQQEQLPSLEGPVLPEEEAMPAEESKPEPAEESKSEPAEESKPEPAEESKPEPAEESKPEPDEESKSEPAEESKPEPAEESKPEPAEESKPEPAEESKPEPAEESKSEPAEESKSEPAEETKPEPAEATKPEPERSPESAEPVPEAPKPADTTAPTMGSPFRLVSFAEEQASGEAVAGRERPGTAEAASPPDAPSGDERAGDVAEESQQGEEAAAETAAPAQNASTDAGDDVPAPQYVPLEKVRDEIRRRLARAKAPEQMQKLLNDLQAAIARYREDLIRHKVEEDLQKGQALPPPEKPDLRKLADEHGLVYENPGMVSALAAQQLDIGKSTVGEASFVTVLFERLPTHRPAISQDHENNLYLFWKLEEVDERVPELDEPEVRERVVRAWKMVQARTLAEQEAERLAAKAREAGQALRAVFPDRAEAAEIVESDPFSWLTYGGIHPLMAQGRPPRISEVRGVTMPGDDFMQAVFGLDVGGVGVAPNAPKSEYYVVRLIESNPAPEALWAMFVSEHYFVYMGAAIADQGSLYEAWLDGIKSASGFAWDPQWQRQ